MAEERTSSYDASSMPTGLENELERLRTQALVSWTREAHHLQRWGLGPGMTVLELGSGPGFVTEQLLSLVPGGEVVAVEIDPVLIERAERYLTGRGLSGWRIIRGNVMDTGLPAGSVDFAYGRYLFQHLPDQAGAARETWRVLKPGGKLALCDVDDDLVIFDPPPGPEVRAIDERLRAAFRAEQASKGGNRLVGRRLVNILRDAGFSGLQLEALVMHSLIEDMSGLIPPPTRESMAPLLADGSISEAELDLMLADYTVFEQSDPVMLVELLMACGTRPAGGEETAPRSA